jgi:FAS-associated factor 2
MGIISFFQEIQKQKIEYQIRIPDEPPADHPEAVHIVIKLPNGMRLERRFLQNHSLEVYCSCVVSF